MITGVIGWHCRGCYPDEVIVDAQIHVWEADRPDRLWPRSGAGGRTAMPQRDVPLSPAEVLAEMDAAGVDRAILVPPSWEGDRNDVALAAVAEHPCRFAVMGRVAADIAPERVATWRTQPGMLGIRVLLSTDGPWVREGADHWLWAMAADTRLPIMIAPGGNIALLATIARRHPTLPLVIDHMGARVHCTGAEAFVDLEQLLALAPFANVAVKATSLPSYSAGPRPWVDAMPYLRRLHSAFGSHRLFWGSDLSRLPCPYGELVDFFHGEIDWLRGTDRDIVMGQGILEWLDWR